jgi:hypothetical protein
VFVVEEKAWGPHVVAGEVGWYVNGERRHNPVGQIAHAARVLAGRLRTQVREWEPARKAPPRGCDPVEGHVVLSHPKLDLKNAITEGVSLPPCRLNHPPQDPAAGPTPGETGHPCGHSFCAM